MPVSQLFDNTPPAVKSLEESIFTPEFAEVIQLRGNEPSHQYQPNTQGIEGIDGSESFADFALASPCPASLIGHDLGGDLIIGNFTEYWQQSPLNLSEISNQRANIVDHGGARGILLNGEQTDTGFTYGAENEYLTTGPTGMWVPIKLADQNWTSIRFGFLAAYDNSNSTGAEKARLKFGLSNTPSPKYLFKRFEAEIYWNTLVYSVSKKRWETDAAAFWRGAFHDYQNDGAPFYGMNIAYSAPTVATTRNFRFLGNAGESVFPIFIELSQAGSDPAVNGANIKIFCGTSSNAIEVDQQTFVGLMQTPINGLVLSNYSYLDLGNIQSESGDWADFNHFSIESWSKGLLIDLVAYQVLAR